jgi:hypothetical protein
MPITSVVTEMRFDTKAATPKLTFKATRALEEDEFNTVIDKGTSPEAQQAIKLNVFKQDQKAKPAAIAAPKPTPKAAVVSEEDGEEENAPKRAPLSKPAAPAAKRSAADIAAEWDDA